MYMWDKDITVAILFMVALLGIVVFSYREDDEGPRDDDDDDDLDPPSDPDGCTT